MGERNSLHLHVRYIRHMDTFTILPGKKEVLHSCAPLTPSDGAYGCVHILCKLLINSTFSLFQLLVYVKSACLLHSVWILLRNHNVHIGFCTCPGVILRYLCWVFFLAVCQALRTASFLATQLPAPHYHCRVGVPTAQKEPAQHWYVH